MKIQLKQNFHNFFSDKKFSEIITGSVWSISAKIITTGFGIINTIITARFYGADILGIVAVINSFLMLTTIFTVLGTNTSILRFIPEHLTRYSPTSAFNVYRKTQYFVASISIITSLLLFLLSGFIAKTIFGKPEFQFYFCMGSAFILFKSLMLLNTQAVRAVRLIKLFAFMQLLPTFAKFVILVIITPIYYKKDNPIYAMFASIVISAVSGSFIIDRTLKHISKPEDKLHNISIKEIIKISTPMLMTATMSFVIGETGLLILSKFGSNEEVGYYSIAVRLATLTAFILNAINTMAGPKFSELFHADKIDELFYVAKKSAKLIFWLTIPILICLVILGKPILIIAFGNSFSSAYPALVILVSGQFVHCISGATGLFMNMTGNQTVYRNIIFFSAILNIIMNLLLTPRYGIYGAASAAMVSLISWNLAALFYIKNKFGKTTGYFPLISLKKYFSDS